MKLSNIIYRATKKHQIPKRIYTAILMQESSYNLKAKKCHKGMKKISDVELEREIKKCFEKAQDPLVEYSKCVKNINELKEVKVCTDFGISQIYYKTAKSYGLDIERLNKDLEYSVYSGALVLSYFKERYADKEPEEWWIRYNIGTRSKSSVIHSWNAYYENVNRYR